MQDNLNNETLQIKSLPKKVELHKFFGPYFGEFTLPEDVIEALIKMTDSLLKDSESLPFGSNLAGVIKEEIFVYKEDLVSFGVNEILENCLKSYILNATKMHTLHNDSYQYESMINSAWIVSQYENEYNPIHNHSGCNVSDVLYLKTPNVKGRRDLHKDKMDTDSDISFLYNAASARNMDVLDRGLLNFCPSVGMLYLFPSYLLHTVYPFVGGEERRSLAFNAVYRIKEGNEIIYGLPGPVTSYPYLEGRKKK